MKTYLAILGRLVARTAVHIGSGEGSEITDSLFRRDVKGHYLIPGTAIGGALRTVATRLAPRMHEGAKLCKALLPPDGKNVDETSAHNEDWTSCNCMVCHLFGEINPNEGRTGGRASRLFIANAKASESQILSSRIRDGVGIDRQSRTAASAAKAKFDLEVLPKGSAFELRLELEDADEDDEQLLAATLAEWQAGRLWLGGRVARGLGAFQLREAQVIRRDLSDETGLMAFLNSDQPWKDAPVIPDWFTPHLEPAQKEAQNTTDGREGVARSFVSLRLDLQFESLFLTNDTVAAALSGFDHAPLLEAIAKDGEAILPGASLRGVLRSQAERIARTLTTLEVDNVSDFGARCPACDPLRRPTKQDEEDARKDMDALPESEKEANRLKHRAALRVPLASCDALLKGYVQSTKEVKDEQLCLACLLFGNSRRGSRLVIEDALSSNQPSRKVLDFLAIDRFTGGGKEGAKFDALALWQPVFSVRLHLENPQDWELGWLALALRDLAEGLVAVGFGAAKGFGQAKIKALTVDYGFISDEDFAGHADIAHSQTSRNSGLFRVLSWDAKDTAQREPLLTLAQGWVDKFNEQRQGFTRKEELRLQRDTYFDAGDISQLYQREAIKWLLNQ
jgi:CRISPR/Cas system CSM-associated protein Csm3 (group 7 of RAMP superfamily)